MYDIKAIPTTYAGTMFRSRLEARWAAFFDLCGWKWVYEPFDLNGWAPDFLIERAVCNVLVEVKPVHFYRPYLEGDLIIDVYEVFSKAIRHHERHQVLLLGLEPTLHFFYAIGILTDPPNGSHYKWIDLKERFIVNDQSRWNEAGNRVQWWPQA